ncbi:MAG TPA: deoxyribose-phosphate aldolase, partial [Candidatus Cloacimonadota bacterium]|nr:deoxyribose-phosphate aldolase [Candidatus Cloacimonadota bacterium]
MNKIEAIAKSIFDLDDSVISRSGGAHRISLQSVIDRSNFPDQLPVSTDNLADLIDHTLLKPEATEEQVIKICQEAETYHFRSVCVNPANASLAKKHLPHVDLCCVIGFPLGANSTEIKVAEASRAIADGAAEIDMVINLGALKSQNHDLVYNEILQIAAICHDRKAILKVIIETCLLN